MDLLKICNRTVSHNHNQKVHEGYKLVKSFIFFTILLRKEVLQSNLRTVRLLQRSVLFFRLPFQKKKRKKNRITQK